MFSNIFQDARVLVPIKTSFKVRSDLHLARKLWHIGMGLLGLSFYFIFQYPLKDIIQFLIVFSTLTFAFDLIRLRVPRLNDLVQFFMRPFMRESEKNSLSGLPFYSLGVTMALILFPERIAVLSVLFLVFADPIASFFGILFGRDKILPNKSLQGSLAAFAVCYILSMVYGMHYSNPNINLLTFSLLAGLIGAVSELCSRFVDDNLSIPVISGVGLSVVNYFFITVF